MLLYHFFNDKCQGVFLAIQWIGQISGIWIWWADFAKAIGKEANDLGIDLVLEMNKGVFWAVQCIACRNHQIWRIISVLLASEIFCAPYHKI